MVLAFSLSCGSVFNLLGNKQDVIAQYFLVIFHFVVFITHEFISSNRQQQQFSLKNKIIFQLYH